MRSRNARARARAHVHAHGHGHACACARPHADPLRPRYASERPCSSTIAAAATARDRASAGEGPIARAAVPVAVTAHSPLSKKVASVAARGSIDIVRLARSPVRPRARSTQAAREALPGAPSHGHKPVARSPTASSPRVSALRSAEERIGALGNAMEAAVVASQQRNSPGARRMPAGGVRADGGRRLDFK